MAGVYETKDGEQYDMDDLERKEKCDFCGELGTIPDGDDFLDGELPSISGESHHGDRGAICRDCLEEGVSKEQIDEVIGSEDEIREELAEREVELA